MALIKCSKCKAEFPDEEYYGYICPQCGTDSRLKYQPEPSSVTDSQSLTSQDIKPPPKSSVFAALRWLLNAGAAMAIFGAVDTGMEAQQRYQGGWFAAIDGIAACGVLACLLLLGAFLLRHK